MKRYWILAVLALTAAASAQQSGPDAGGVSPEKEQPAVLAAAGAASGKFKGYKANYTMVISDSKSDSSASSNGTISMKNKNGMTIVLQENGNSGDTAAAHRDIITPGKKLIRLYPDTKTGEEHDLSKEKDLSFWTIVSVPFASLSKDFTLKCVKLSGRYDHEHNTYTNMGGDTRKDFKDPAAGKKPSFDPWTCHRFELTPKNGAWAAAVKKITVMVDMNVFCVTRVEFDFKGDGSKTSSFAVAEIEFDAKLDDKLFDVEKDFTVKKEEPKKEEKK